MKLNDKQNVIAICIATYNRPIGLERLLLSLKNLNFEKVESPKWKIIIIDNDPQMPNQEIIDRYESQFVVPLIYDKESTRGIASVRNRCIQLAGEVDFIAFVDDDEIVQPDWLDELIYAINLYQADVVLGPVLPQYNEPPPAWLIKGKFHDRFSHLNGEELKTANTGNILMKRHWLDAVDGPFDERLNLTGGSDTLFFYKIHELGAKIIWTNDAAVEEFSPPERATSSYLIKRAFRRGNALTYVELIMNPTLKTRITRAIKGSYHLIKGFLLLIPKLIIFGYAGLLNSFLNCCGGIGELLGLIGFRYQIYAQVNGD